MGQERIDDFIQMAKDYAKAEKELGVQRWVRIMITRVKKDGERERLFTYDLPREVYERRPWVIEWRKAKFVCQYPRDHVRCYQGHYDIHLGTDARLNEDLSKLISAKAQVTKAKRAIDVYMAYNRTNNLFFDENTDAELQKAREKLRVKIADVRAAEERMKFKIKQLQETGVS